MLDPKPIEIKDQDGNIRHFILHKVPAVPMREIVSKYPTANLPRIGDYATSEAVALKLLAFAHAVTPTGAIPLNSSALVNNHCKDWEVMAQLELAMLEYNVSFFGSVKNFASWEGFLKTHLPKILSMLTASLQPLSPTDAPPSKN